MTNPNPNQPKSYVTPNRSILVVPGHWPMEKLKKAQTYGADRILWDLEDGVPEDKKYEARYNIWALAVDRDLNPARDMIRVRPRSDRKEIRLGEYVPLVIPKCEYRDDDLWRQLKEEAHHGIYPLIETPYGVSNLGDFRERCDARVNGILFGAHDLAHRLNVPTHSAAIGYAAAKIAMFARGQDLPCWAPPEFAIGNDARIRSHARHYQDYGFTGMGVIHPDQLRIVHDVFRPRYTQPSPQQRVADLAREHRVNRAVQNYELAGTEKVIL